LAVFVVKTVILKTAVITIKNYPINPTLSYSKSKSNPPQSPFAKGEALKSPLLKEG
jgi:hypothetical protein